MPLLGFQMSNRAAVRRRPASDRNPDSSGGNCCTGLGLTSDSGIEKNSPSKETGSGAQHASSAAMSSSIRRPRERGSTPICTCSSSDQPADRPATSRPFISWSSVERCWASSIGRW